MVDARMVKPGVVKDDGNGSTPVYDPGVRGRLNFLEKQLVRLLYNQLGGGRFVLTLEERDGSFFVTETLLKDDVVK